METYGIQVLVGDERELLVRVDGTKGGPKDPRLAHVVKELAVETHFTEKEILELHDIYVAMETCEDQIFSSASIGREIMKRCSIPSTIAEFFFDAEDEVIPFPVMVYVSSIFARGTKQERLAYLFSAIDQNSSGNLSKDEVERVVVALLLLKGNQSTDPSVVNNAVEKIWASADSDGDSSLSFVEFLEHADTCVELLGLKEIFSVNTTTLQYMPSTRLSSASSTVSAPTAGKHGSLFRNNTIGSFFGSLRKGSHESRKNSFKKTDSSPEEEESLVPTPSEEKSRGSEGPSTPAPSPPPLSSSDSKGSFWSKLKEKRNTEPTIPKSQEELPVSSAETAALRAVQSSSGSLQQSGSKEGVDEQVRTPLQGEKKRPEAAIELPTKRLMEIRSLPEPMSDVPRAVHDRSESIVSGSGLAKAASSLSSSNADSSANTPSSKVNDIVWEVTEADEED